MQTADRHGGAGFMEAEGRRADSWWVESFYTRMDTCPRRARRFTACSPGWPTDAQPGRQPPRCRDAASL